MNFIKKHKNKIILCVAVIAVLALAFLGGGNSPSHQKRDDVNTSASLRKKDDSPLSATSINNTESILNSISDAIKTEKNTTPQEQPKEEYIPEEKAIETNETSAEKHEISIDEQPAEQNTTPNPDEFPDPIELENTVISDKELTCTLSIRCDTILNNTEWFDSEKAEIIPTDGIIFPEKSVIFYEGESVFNILVREMKKSKTHLEFVNTPVYNSAYIEGIGNIYEFDFGELSGWMYKVNDWFPNYGCSRYQLHDGDKVEFIYTCDLGKDVGGSYSPRNGM